MKLKPLKNQEDHEFEDGSVFSGVTIRIGNFGVNRNVINGIGSWLEKSYRRKCELDAFVRSIHRCVKTEVRMPIKNQLDSLT